MGDPTRRLHPSICRASHAVGSGYIFPHRDAAASATSLHPDDSSDAHPAA
jgi:hypothetical protein